MPSVSDFLSNIINGSADAYGVPRNIAYGLVQQETSFRTADPTFSSGANSNGTHDWGPFQLNDATFPTAPNMTLVDQANTSMGLLGNLFKKYNDWGQALSAYNTGSPIKGSAYAQSVLAKAQGFTDVNTAVQTGQQVNPNFIADAATQMGAVDINASGNSASSPQNNPNPTAPPTIGQGIAQNVADAIGNEVKSLTTSFKNYFSSSGIHWAVIILGGGLVIIAALSTIESGGSNSGAKAPKIVPVPL